MPRLHTPAIDTAIGPTAQVYAQIRKSLGRVPSDMAAIGAHDPEALKAILQADAVLATSTLSKQDQETIKSIVSEAAGCDYCLAALRIMGNVRASSPTGDNKRDALIRFVRNLVETTGTIDPASLEAIKAAGYTDAELVDISLAIAVMVFVSTFNRINDTTVDFPSMS